MRETLETAALSASVQQATDVDRDKAVAIHTQMELAIHDDDPLAYHRRSREFHLALTRPSHMHRLLHMLESAWNMTEPVQPMVHVARNDRIALHSDHQEMLDAFLACDLPRLLAACERHHHRLNSVIATLPTDTGLLAEKDISLPQ